MFRFLSARQFFENTRMYHLGRSGRTNLTPSSLYDTIENRYTTVNKMHIISIYYI